MTPSACRVSPSRANVDTDRSPEATLCSVRNPTQSDNPTLWRVRKSFVTMIPPRPPATPSQRAIQTVMPGSSPFASPRG